MIGPRKRRSSLVWCKDSEPVLGSSTHWAGLMAGRGSNCSRPLLTGKAVRTTRREEAGASPLHPHRLAAGLRLRRASACGARNSSHCDLLRSVLGRHLRARRRCSGATATAPGGGARLRRPPPPLDAAAAPVPLLLGSGAEGELTLGTDTIERSTRPSVSRVTPGRPCNSQKPANNPESSDSPHV